MAPWLVRLWRPLINRELVRRQRIVELEVAGSEHVRQALAGGAGILITPNHSFHYDSYVLIEAAHRVGRPFHFLTAWQVFAMSKWLEQRVLQWHGCFSINREASDLQAFKTAVEILRADPLPLVIFPEGDIYHNHDRVTPFRDGAAAIAMSAAKKADRPVVCIPAALKCFYVDDPTPQLQRLMTRLEESLHWRPRPDLPLLDRIYRFAEGLLALKEYEELGQPQSGRVPERTIRLAETIVARLERRHQVICKGGCIPERVKEVRRAVIKAIEQDGTTAEAKDRLAIDLEDLFFVIQLFSYPGDYVAQRPTIERIAETLDKFEEDVLRADYPGIRGTRRAVVRFGEPVPVPKEREGKGAVERWTELVESRVQGLLDEINGLPPTSRHVPPPAAMQPAAVQSSPAKVPEHA
jgi:1-acyl-sn-glycerol-3-phosphate acyltransferase